jgi:hypothetical protein
VSACDSSRGDPPGNPQFRLLQRGKLPDTHALIGREIVRAPWLYSEGRIPGVHIAGWADYPERVATSSFPLFVALFCVAKLFIFTKFLDLGG